MSRHPSNALFFYTVEIESLDFHYHFDTVSMDMLNLFWWEKHNRISLVGSKGVNLSPLLSIQGLSVIEGKNRIKIEVNKKIFIKEPCS